MQDFGKQYSIKATKTQVMQFTIPVRQYQTDNYIIQLHNTHNLTGYLF